MVARIGPVLADSAIGDVHVTSTAPTVPPPTRRPSPSTRPTDCSDRAGLQTRGSSCSRATSRLPAVVLGASRQRARHRSGRRHRPGLARRPLVLSRRHPRPAPACPRARPHRPDRISDRRASARTPTASPVEIYVRTDPTSVGAVAAVLPATADPAAPQDVSSPTPPTPWSPGPTRQPPSRDSSSALGAVALLVGGIGIANVMVIAVLERRGEIGLRRALGRHHVPHRHPVRRRVGAARPCAGERPGRFSAVSRPPSTPRHVIGDRSSRSRSCSSRSRSPSLSAPAAALSRTRASRLSQAEALRII